MKIKMTIIAFFASVLVLTSCMKNEVSPGIEQVRTAYAAFLNAKAQAEVIKANADAALQMAKAKVEEANAAFRLAEAAGKEAETEAALALLAHNIEVYKVTLDSLKRVEQALLDAYNLGVQQAKEAAVALYFGNYKLALQAVTNTQIAIYDKQRQIVMLNLDLVNGTDSALTAAKADLVKKQATLATLEAELVAAKALLGDADATTAKIAQLYTDSTLLRHELAQKAIERQGMEADYATEAATLATKGTAYTNALAAEAAAKYKLAKVDSMFQATHPDPDFWVEAKDSVTNEQARLNTAAADTLASFTALKNANDTIALGTTDITAKLVLINDSLAAYADTLATLHADSVAKGLAEVASRAALAAVYADSTAKEATLVVVSDSAAAQYARWWAAALPVYTAQAAVDSLKYLTSANDSTLLKAQLFIIHNTDIPAAIADTVAKLALEVAATGAYNTFKTTKYDVITPITAARKVACTADLATRTARIAWLTANLADLNSDYLYHQTLIAPLVANVATAKAYKESRRADYETYMEEFLVSYTASLQAIVDAKVAATAAAKAAKDAAAAAHALVFEPTRLLDSVIAVRTAALADMIIVKGLYAALDVVNDNFLAAFEAAITTAKTNVTNCVTAVGVAEWTYANGLVNYDKFMADMAELNAKLAAEQVDLAYWKALLDEALAN